MSSLTILLMLIFCLMSLGNVFCVVSIFGYDANHYEVSEIMIQEIKCVHRKGIFYSAPQSY